MVVPAEHFDAGKTLAAVAGRALHGALRRAAHVRCRCCATRRSSAPISRSLRTGIVMGADVPAGAHARRSSSACTSARSRSPTARPKRRRSITQTRTEDSLDLRATTVGRALPDVEVKIVDPKSGVELPVGGEGELCCRGYPVMRGYYKMPEATAADDRSRTVGSARATSP